MVYFKGNIKEVRSLTPPQIVRILKKAGISFESKSKALEEARGLKQKILKSKKARNVVPNLRKMPESPANLKKLLAIMEQNSNIRRVHIKGGSILLRIKKTRTGTVLVSPMPMTHGITGSRKTPFEDLVSILENGFKGKSEWSDSCNVYWSKDGTRRRKGLMTLQEYKNPQLTGDTYSIEMVAIAPEGYADFVDTAAAKQILSVNIELSKSIPEVQQRERIKFYTEQIRKRFDIPVKFI